MNTTRRPAIESVGERFGMLVVTEVYPVKGRSIAKAKCDCGREWEGSLVNLRRKNTTSCGCIGRKLAADRKRTHGMTGTPEWGIWCTIKSRCYNPNTEGYQGYGGRGITMFQEWVNDFAAFYTYIGPRPSVDHSVERSDNNLGYIPGNVSWQDKTVQANNTRRNRLITVDGVTKNMRAWCEELNINYATVCSRITSMGWDPLRAISTPTLQPYYGTGQGRLSADEKLKYDIARTEL